MASRKADWPGRALALAGIVPRTRLHPAALAWVEAAEVEEPWLVAFSGGADSLALLLLLWAHWPERRRTLRALHFNHGLRGRAADADERFCRAVCERLRVKLRVGAWKNPPRHPAEAEARRARQAFFSRELARSGAKGLWLGHQQDDIVETLLMRLARGSGTAGLCAPRPMHRFADGIVHLRPMLTLGKGEIEEALTRTKASWRTDATNATGTFLRNRIRREVLPAWRKAVTDRDAVAGAALSRERLEEDDAALESWVSEVAPVMPDGSLNLRRLANKPRGVVRRALHLWLGGAARGVGLSRQAFEALLNDVMCARVTRHSLGAAGFAEIRATRLRLIAPGGN